MKKMTKRILVILLAAAVLFSLTGCKESLVITKVLYDQQQEEEDKQNEQKILDQEEEAEEKTDELPEVTMDDSSDRNTKEQKVASASGSGTGYSTQSVTMNHAQNTGTQKDKNASKKSGAGESNKKKESKPAETTDNKEKAGDQSGTKESEEKKDKKESDKGKNEEKKGKSDASKDDSKKKDSQDDESEEAQDQKQSKEKRQVYNKDGEVIDLPEEVTSVVAPGAAGVMTMMLGGKGVLVGTSESLMTGLAANVFAGYGVNDAAMYWPGIGDEPMDSSALNALLEAAPDVCVGVAGQDSFTASQIKKLQEKKIAYVSLPELTTHANIQKAMEILADVIGDRSSTDGGKKASSVLSKYINQCSKILKKAEKKGKESIYSLYISGWDDEAELTVALGNGDVLVQEQGMAIVRNGTNWSPINYYLEEAGVVNNGAQLSKKAGTFYAGIPLNLNLFSDSTQVSGGNVVLYNKGKNSFARYGSGSDDGGGISLGEKKFPAVIVNSEETRAKLEGSKNAGIWQNFGKTTMETGDNTVTDYGFVSQDTLVRTFIRGDYEIYVNPSGVTSWNEGSPESVLESIWAAYQIRGADMDDVKDAIKDFYSTFYEYNLSGDEVKQILAGE